MASVIAHGLADGIRTGAREVELALLNGALDGGGGIGGELVVDGERDAATGELKIADLLTLHVEHGNDRHHTVARELLTVAQDDRVGIADAQAVDVHDAGLDGAAALDDAVAHLEGIAVVDHEDVLGGDAHLLAERGVRAQVHGLAVDGHEVARLGESEHELKLLLAGVAGNVDQGTALVVRASMSLSSSWLAWPETCTRARLLSYTSQPSLARLFTTCWTAFSLPGTGVAEMMTVSPSWMDSVLCSPLAIRERAESGSPCEPVHMTTSLSSGMPLISNASSRSFSSTFR